MKKKINKTSLQLQTIINQPYKYGFSTKINSEDFPRGLNNQIINLISEKKMIHLIYEPFA